MRKWTKSDSAMTWISNKKMLANSSNIHNVKCAGLTAKISDNWLPMSFFLWWLQTKWKQKKLSSQRFICRAMIKFYVWNIFVVFFVTANSTQSIAKTHKLHSILQPNETAYFYSDYTLFWACLRVEFEGNNAILNQLVWVTSTVQCTMSTQKMLFSCVAVSDDSSWQ